MGPDRLDPRLWHVSHCARTIAGMIHVTFLGSGSAGNSTLVTWGGTSVLIDCGFSAREITRRLASHGEDAGRVKAVFVTHEHSDHARGLRVFAERTGAAVFASEGTARAAHAEGRGPFEHERVSAGRPITLGDLEILPFAVSHDAQEPLGFVISAPDGTRLGYASDLGCLTRESAEALADCDLLALEANHDPDMLAHGPYPTFLKRRIASRVGHLSNVAAADALESMATRRLRHVFAVHVSRTNNTGTLAVDSMRERLRRLGIDAGVTAVGQDTGVRFPDRQAALF